MRLSWISILVFGICGVLANTKIDIRFKEYMIVPTYLSAAPKELLSVRYNGIVVNLGNEISSPITEFPPYISYEANPNDLYSVVIVDLDVPSVILPYESPYLHNLIMNIPGANVTAGEALSTYIPATPYPGSGYHRYVFLVYKQSSKIDTKAPELLRLRRDNTNFSLFEFSSRYQLGVPVAGNFFTSSLIVCDGQRITGAPRTCSLR